MAAPMMPEVLSLFIARAIRIGIETIPKRIPNPCVRLLTNSCFMSNFGFVVCMKDKLSRRANDKKILRHRYNYSFSAAFPLDSSCIAGEGLCDILFITVELN